MKLTKLSIVLGAIFALICYFTKSNEILWFFTGTVASIVNAFLPCILIIGGIYILIRCVCK